MEKDIQERLSEIENKLSAVITALMGSEITRDGGLVKRVENIEIKFDLDAKKNDEFRNSLYRLLWFAFGVGVGSGFLGMYFFNMIKSLL